MGARVGLVVARREGRGVVAHVGDVGAAEAGRQRRGLLGDGLHLAGQRDARQVHAEDLGATLDVGQTDLDRAVEAARPQQRRVQAVGPVGAREHDDVACRRQAHGAHGVSRRRLVARGARGGSGRLRAPVVLKPSISTSSWLSVFSRSSLPPPSPAPR